MTFLAPAWRCPSSSERLRKTPVDSMTYSTPRSAQGISEGARAAVVGGSPRSWRRRRPSELLVEREVQQQDVHTRLAEDTEVVVRTEVKGRGEPMLNLDMVGRSLGAVDVSGLEVSPSQVIVTNGGLAASKRLASGRSRSGVLAQSVIYVLSHRPT